jgi:hypothetical protein
MRMYPRRKRRLSPEERHALELLATSPNGTTADLLMQSHGFTRRMLAGLVNAGLAAARRQMIKAGARAIEVNRITITDLGLRAIEGVPEAE